MINYYRDMWIRRSDVLAPLTYLVSEERKWEWKEDQQKAFETIKQIFSKETLLTYPDCNQPFDIHTDAGHTQLGAVISPNN
jgi:RNase H-like domain found in reverse transcriptase